MRLKTKDIIIVVLSKVILLTSILFLGGIIFKTETHEDQLVRVANKSIPKTVTITVDGIDEFHINIFGFDVNMGTFPVVIRGSGVFISPNNHVLTCQHLFTIVQVDTITVCRYDDSCSEAELLYVGNNVDLGLLKTAFETPTNYARIADPRRLKVGQEVIAIGYPLDLPFTVTHGIISRLYTDELGYNLTQSDTFLNPGNSGGPLFNLKGELVGINSRIRPPVNAPVFTGLGFSVQCGQIIEFLTKFKGLEKTWQK